MKTDHDHWAVVKTMRPGQSGTIKLQRRYGGALVCVRYREDAAGLTRRITVELIVEDHAIQPRMIWATIPKADQALRATAMTMGAIWHSRTKRWLVPAKTAKVLGLCRIGTSA